MNAQKVSLIMSVYNGEAFLEETINSVLKQTFADFEFVIVNDGSTDKSLEIINQFIAKDSRVKVVNNVKNIGLTKSLNIGIQHSIGEYIARLDAGDFSYPQRFEEQVKFLDQNQDVGLVGSWAYVVDESRNKLKELKYPLNDKEIKKSLIKYNPFVHSSIMFRKSVVSQIEFYNTDYFYAQDYELYFRLWPYTQFANIPSFLVEYRRYSESITSTKNKEQVLFANKSRKYAIEKGYYKKYNYVYIFKNYLVSLIPTRLKFFIKKFI